MWGDRERVGQRRLRGPAVLGLFVSLAVSGYCSEAEAFERQWHLGIDFGYALAGFPEAVAGGYGGGLHVAYGITDAFNLRLQGDVTVFDLPEPATSALIYDAAFGVEYVIDILRWVPYIGALAGPVYVARQDAEDSAGVVTEHEDSWLLGLEIPLGLGYQLSRSFTIGLEGRYRVFLLGGGTSPTSSLLGLGRLEYMWGF